MERLTEKTDNGYMLKIPKDKNISDLEIKFNVYDKLGHYEDAEEQGLMLLPPCKNGDTIYVVPSKVNFDLNIVNKHEENNRVYEQKVYSVQMWSNRSYVLNTCDGLYCVRSDSYGETWFLTPEEAAGKLKELSQQSVVKRGGLHDTK